jgi:hypothetical protein
MERLGEILNEIDYLTDYVNDYFVDISNIYQCVQYRIKLYGFNEQTTYHYGNTEIFMSVDKKSSKIKDNSSDIFDSKTI